MTVNEALEIVSKTDPLSVEKWFNQLVESKAAMEAVTRAVNQAADGVDPRGDILALICIAYEAGRVAEAHEREALGRFLTEVSLPLAGETPDA